MRAQAYVLQFLLLMLLGLSVSGLLAALFKSYYEHSSKELERVEMEAAGSYFSAWVLRLNSCSYCNLANLSLSVPSKRVMHLTLSQQGMEVLSLATHRELSSSLHNLNWSYELRGSAMNAKPIRLIYNRVENYIEVGN